MAVEAGVGGLHKIQTEVGRIHHHTHHRPRICNQGEWDQRYTEQEEVDQKEYVNANRNRSSSQPEEEVHSGLEQVPGGIHFRSPLLQRVQILTELKPGHSLDVVEHGDLALVDKKGSCCTRSSYRGDTIQAD